MQAYGSLMWLVVFGGIMYFFMIRPQQKQRKEREKLLNSLEKGDKIVTIGGLHGTITSLEDHTAVLEIAPNVKITIQRSAVSFVKVDEDNK